MCRVVEDALDAVLLLGVVILLGLSAGAERAVLTDGSVRSLFSIKNNMVNAGGEWSDKEVVMDGPLLSKTD